MQAGIFLFQDFVQPILYGFVVRAFLLVIQLLLQVARHFGKSTTSSAGVELLGPQHGRTTMNKQKLSEMRYARVKVRPMALDSSTGQWRRVDDKWIIVNASREKLELHNPRTRDTIPLGTDHVREFMSDPGGSEGFQRRVPHSEEPDIRFRPCAGCC